MEDCGFCALGEGGFYFLKNFCLVSGTLCFWACYIKNIGGAKLRGGKKKEKKRKQEEKKRIPNIKLNRSISGTS